MSRRRTQHFSGEKKEGGSVYHCVLLSFSFSTVRIRSDLATLVFQVSTNCSKRVRGRLYGRAFCFVLIEDEPISGVVKRKMSKRRGYTPLPDHSRFHIVAAGSRESLYRALPTC